MTDTNLSLVLLMFVACAFHSIPETLLATSTGFAPLCQQKDTQEDIPCA